MEFQRNKPCPCGSGQKYKRCHYGRPFDPVRDLLLRERNRIVLNAAKDIFGFSAGRSWQNLKRTISGKQIRQFYELQAALWPPDTDWTSIMPTPDGKLRGLYLGDIRPQTTLRNLIRFSLYSDELFVINPFPNPWHIRPAYNPIENPDQYKADTLNLLFFLFSVEPWIESGILHLIPDPGELNLELKLETARLAKVRRGERPADKRDLEEGRELGHEELLRVLCALPEDEIFRLFERSGKVLGEAEKRQLAAYARRTLRNDPVALSQPIGESSKDGQLIVMRAGVNLETALLICSATGAFPYTDMWTRWEELNSRQ